VSIAAKEDGSNATWTTRSSTMINRLQELIYRSKTFVLRYRDAGNADYSVFAHTLIAFRSFGGFTTVPCFVEGADAVRRAAGGS
jgi:hypothetical protein